MTMPSRRSIGCGIEAESLTSSDSVRKPCAIGTPHGDSSLHASGSTWMNWWSSVTSANELIRSWSTSSQSPVPSLSPIADLNSSYAASAFVVMAVTLRVASAAITDDPERLGVGHPEDPTRVAQSLPHGRLDVAIADLRRVRPDGVELAIDGGRD